LRVLCLMLHLGLISLHLILLGIWVVHLEHKIVFPLDMQSRVSLALTLLTTSFGICYFSVLVFVTQRLTFHYNLQKGIILTQIHDIAYSWTGIGSALANLYSQLFLTVSLTGTLAVVGYLGGISILHVTTPSLLSVETFNRSMPSDVETFGFPQFNTSDNTYANPLDFEAEHKTSYALMQKTSGFVPWIGNLDDSERLGLYNGTIYDVLQDVYPQGRSAQVSAVGYNITCGYLAGVNTHVEDKNGLTTWTVSFPQFGSVVHILSTG
ncbi:hypothetical protein B0H13DRAFT_1481338, partial [Mycena leptocephala]